MSRIFSLSLLRLLEESGFGEIDKDLFWQKMTLNRVGVYVSDVASSQERGSRPSYTFEIYSRGSDDVDGYLRLNKISDFISNRLGVSVSLPETGFTEKGYSCVVFDSITAPSSVGQDNQGRMIYAITGLARVIF